MKSSIGRRGASILIVVVILVLAAFGLYFFFKSLREAREIEKEMETPPPPAATREEPAPPVTSAPPPAPSPGKGGVDYSWTLKTLDGKDVQLSRYKGKVIFLTFWATWCGYCRMEMPSIQKLYEATGSDQIAFLMVSAEGVRPVKDFLSKNSYTLPVFLQSGNTPALFRTQGIPATFIIDKTGAIARREVGARDWSTDEIKQFLKKLA